METLLMTQALDERDLLRKRIFDKITKTSFVCAVGKDEESNEEEIKSAYQSVVDLIDRYKRLESAIIKSNATTMVTIREDTMSVAEAIVLKNRLHSNSASAKVMACFEAQLAFTIEDEYKKAVQVMDRKNLEVERAGKEMMQSLVSGESSDKTTAAELVDKYIEQNKVSLVDPLDSVKLVEELRSDLLTLSKDIDVAIKVSNATTTIEF